MTLAKAVVASRMAPRGLESPEACMIAILHGLEVGLMPLSALQRIAVIDGRPTIWGDGAMALVRASGLCRSVREWIEGETSESWLAHCEVSRKGETDCVVRSFSVQDARRAGLWGRIGPWSAYPKRMLQMRARAFALRDVFADVLGGLYLREEIEDESILRYPPPSIPDCTPPAVPSMAQADHSDCETSHQMACDEMPALDAADNKGASGPPPGLPGGSQDLAPALVPQRPVARRKVGKRRAKGWVRLRAPREAIRLRAPPPPEYASSAPGETSGATYPTDGDSDPADGSRLTSGDVLALFDHALACSQDQATLHEVEQEFAQRLEKLSREDVERAERIRLRHANRIAALAGEPFA